MAAMFVVVLLAIATTCQGAALDRVKREAIVGKMDKTFDFLGVHMGLKYKDAAQPLQGGKIQLKVDDLKKIYEGSFVNGLPYGRGTMTYPEGWKYEGNWKDGKFYDHGTFTWSPNNYFEGQFMNGELVPSHGEYYTEEGGVYKQGRYYPNAADESESYRAEFDGKTLRYEKPVVTKGGVKKGGY